MQGEPDRAATVLGRPPDQIRDPLPTALLSTLWRLHGRVAHARGEQSRAIALHGRALKYAEAAHDSRGIGLAHFELVYCYLKVGDHAIVREHLTEAAAALHAAGDRRHLAQVHSVSGVMFAQQGRYDDATAALRNAERLATALGAEDVLALDLHEPGGGGPAAPPLRPGDCPGRAGGGAPGSHRPAAPARRGAGHARPGLRQARPARRRPTRRCNGRWPPRRRPAGPRSPAPSTTRWPRSR